MLGSPPHREPQRSPENIEFPRSDSGAPLLRWTTLGIRGRASSCTRGRLPEFLCQRSLTVPSGQLSRNSFEPPPLTWRGRGGTAPGVQIKPSGHRKVWAFAGQQIPEVSDTRPEFHPAHRGQIHSHQGIEGPGCKKSSVLPTGPVGAPSTFRGTVQRISPGKKRTAAARTPRGASTATSRGGQNSRHGSRRRFARVSSRPPANPGLEAKIRD